jgi:hypothetical protein
VKDLARQRTIERLRRENSTLRKLITFLLIFIVFLLVCLAQPSYAQTYQVRNPKGCISFFDSTIYINIAKDSILGQLNIKHRFFLKGSDYFRVTSGKYSGFFVMDKDKAYLIVNGNKTGEHYTQWYFFRKPEEY